MSTTAATVAQSVVVYLERILSEVGPDAFMFDISIWAIDHDKTAHLHFYEGYGADHDEEAAAA